MADISIVTERTQPYKMSKEHRDMYIDALRSGNYEQVTGQYIDEIEGENDKPCMCAVGVYLAQLNDLEDLMDAKEDGHSGIDFGELHDESRAYGDKEPYLLGDIIDLNDGLEMSFEGIADWLEENVEEIVT